LIEQHPVDDVGGSTIGDLVGDGVVGGDQTGYAVDGFGGVGGEGADSVILTSAQLKNCSGHVVPRVPSLG